MQKSLHLKANLVVLMTLISCQISFSQNQGNIWYFGDQAGLDFNGGSPVALTNGVLSGSSDCSSAISDNTGSILFYTNGLTVWNKNHVIMANGTGLLGGNTSGQAALIVPQPGTLFYYIFTVDNFAGPNGFLYHIVDLSQNAGLGAVTSMNNVLFSPSTERIDAVFNPSDNSYWVVTHRWNSNEFSSYKLTSLGLNTTPVQSSVGTVHSGGIPNGYNALGQMTISPLGSMLVCAIYSLGIIEVFDFNVTTGIVSNSRIINGYPNAWGTAFSPDESKLYITQWYGQDVIQFDLNAGTWTDVINSASVVGTALGPGTSGYYIGYLQLAPDQKIYAAVYDDTCLAAINNPNALGNACNFVDNGMYLAGKHSYAGLCRTIPVHSEPKGNGIESFELDQSLIIFPNPAKNEFTISSDLLFNNARFEIYDSFGKRIYQQSKITTLNNKILTEQIPSGIYFIRIFDSQKLASQKLIIE